MDSVLLLYFAIEAARLASGFAEYLILAAAAFLGSGFTECFALEAAHLASGLAE